MKMVIVHSQAAEGRRLAEQLQMFAAVTLAEGMAQVRAEREAGPIVLLVSLDLVERVRERMPGVPLIPIQEPYSLGDVIKSYETMQKSHSVGTAHSSTDAPSVPTQSTPSTVPSVGTELDSRQPRGEHLPFRKRRIPVIVFVSPKGGQGRTTVCTHMAAYGAARAKRIAILDLDVNCNAAEKFGQTQQFASDGWRGLSVGDALRCGAAVEAMPNVYVFSFGRPLERDMTEIDRGDIEHALGVCMEEMDVVLIDTKQEWGPIHGFLLSLATQLVYVVAAQKDALGNLSQRTRDLEQRMSGRQSDVHCILNQTIGPKDPDVFAAYLVPYKPAVTVPYDDKYKRKGGIGLKVLIDRCTPWWDSIFGFPAKPERRRWFWFRRG